MGGVKSTHFNIYMSLLRTCWPKCCIVWSKKFWFESLRKYVVVSLKVSIVQFASFCGYDIVCLILGSRMEWRKLRLVVRGGDILYHYTTGIGRGCELLLAAIMAICGCRGAALLLNPVKPMRTKMNFSVNRCTAVHWRDPQIWAFSRKSRSNGNPLQCSDGS